MNFEVEQKHRVDDPAALNQRLEERGVTLGPPIVQADQYFNHPCRDFAQSDEALRIRTVGDASFVTYKGPNLDATTKTRRELELPLAASSDDFTVLLGALGFRPVAIVRKVRRPFAIAVGGRLLHGAWDEVDGVGTYVELELLADEAGLDEAKKLVGLLARELELGPSERRSYLEMLLSKTP